MVRCLDFETIHSITVLFECVKIGASPKNLRTSGNFQPVFPEILLSITPDSRKQEKECARWAASLRVRLERERARGAAASAAVADPAAGYGAGASSQVRPWIPCVMVVVGKYFSLLVVV